LPAVRRTAEAPYVARARTPEPDRVTVSRRAGITLARCVEFTPAAPGIVPDELDEVVDLAALADFADPANSSMATSTISAMDPL
jgi:hypothetical protein